MYIGFLFNAVDGCCAALTVFERLGSRAYVVITNKIFVIYCVACRLLSALSVWMNGLVYNIPTSSFIK
jgi:hypothetical protein